MSAKRIMIYIEGEGGGGTPSKRKRLKGEFRKSWGAFLSPLAEHAKKQGVVGGFQCIASEGGGDAIKRFCSALPEDEMALRILLVDSEAPVADVNLPWKALKKACPPGSTDDHCYLMVQCLETWLLADLEGLKKYYNKPKPCFLDKKIPAWSNLETVDRKSLQSALEQATAHSEKQYKHADGNILIGLVDREKLKKLKSVDRLFRGFEKVISAYAAA